MNKRRISLKLLWLLCITILLSVIYLGINISDSLLRIVEFENNKLFGFMIKSMKFSIVIIVIFYWIFFSVLLHTISILINVNIKSDFNHLLCINGIGFIFVLIGLIINKYFLFNDLGQLNISEIDLINTFNTTVIAKVATTRLKIAYSLYFIWGIIHTKRIYKLPWIDIILLTLFVILFMVILQFIKGTI